MCGIAGLIYKDSTNISENILDMLRLIQHRGPDASGIAVFYPDREDLVLRATLKNKDLTKKYYEAVSMHAKILDTDITYVSGNVIFSEIGLSIDDDKIGLLHTEINKLQGITVHSISKGMRVYKENGPIVNLTDRHGITKTDKATHGIGHVRMATESAEDVNAAHPFVSPFYPDLAIVHNGQFTNYFNMRRFLESKGATFKTMNDSEAASHLIAYAMRENHGDLEKALRFALDEMDGIFCILAATSRQMGFVKDKLGIKPLLLIEDENKIMIGSEQIEFSELAGNAFAEEMEPGEVRVWNI